MATFKSGGLAALTFDMQAVENMPDSVKDEMLVETGKIAVTAMKRSLQQLGLIDTQHLINSIVASKPKRDGKGRAYIVVYPQGSREDMYVGQKLRKVRIKGRTKKGAPVKMTNNDVGFVLEFGAPKRGVRAYQWLRRANEDCAEDIDRAQAKIYDEFLKSKNL